MGKASNPRADIDTRSKRDRGALTLPARRRVLRFVLLFSTLALVITVAARGTTRTTQGVQRVAEFGKPTWARLTHVEAIGKTPERAEFQVLPDGAMILGVLSIAAFVLAWLLAGWLAQRWSPLRDRCDMCGYPHQNPRLPAEVCPECGAAIFPQLRFRFSLLIGTPVAWIPFAFSFWMIAFNSLARNAERLEEFAKRGSIRFWGGWKHMMELGSYAALLLCFLSALTIIVLHRRRKST